MNKTPATPTKLWVSKGMPNEPFLPETCIWSHMLSSIPSSARSSYVAIPLCFNGLGQGKIYRKPRFDHANIGVPFWFPVYKCSLEYLESNHIKSQRFLGWNMKLWLTCFNHHNGSCLTTIFKARCSSFHCEASPGTSSFRCSIAPWTSPGIVGGHPNGSTKNE